jgi:hypothetical protein
MDVNGLYVAFCIVLFSKILGEIGQCPPIALLYAERLLRSTAPFVQTMTVNCIFGLAVALFEKVPTVTSLFDAIDAGVDPSVVEKGLSLFMRHHFVTFAGSFRWRSTLQLLSFCVSGDSQLCLKVFRDLLARARDTTLDFEQCWVPIVRVLIVLVRGGKTAYTIDLQTMLHNAKLSSTQWGSVFYSVLFPALPRNGREVAAVGLLKIVVNTFLNTMPVLEESPLFESLWFRVLSGVLEFGRAPGCDGKEEVTEMVAVALKVMKAAGAFGPKGQRMWEVTKASIEQVFPDVITSFLTDDE